MTDYMGRTLADAIKAAAKLKDELPHIVQVYPSDHDTIIMAAEIERLRVVLLRIADWLRYAPMESGVCCCGDPIEGHGYDSGHSPVDAVQYSAMQLESEIRAALGDTK